MAVAKKKKVVKKKVVKKKVELIVAAIRALLENY